MPATFDSPLPAISVLMPFYNAARYIGQAVDSILAQTFADFEVIAVDDGSTDDSRARLECIAARDPRVRVISRRNTGIVGALNDGLTVAKGEFIARMDADDISLPERFEKQLAYLLAHPTCICVGSAFLYIDAKGGYLKECVRALDHYAIERELLSGNGGIIIHPASMFRRAAIEQVGAYREKAQWIEDLDLYLRLARVGDLANLAEVLFHYRFHEESVNFSRNQGRHERKLLILAEAHAERGLPFDSSKQPPSNLKSAITPDDLRDFAISSLRFGKYGRPWHYAFRSLRADPTSRATWSTISYLSKYSLGLIRC